MLGQSPFAASTPPALATMIHMLGCSTNKSDAAEVDGDEGGWIRSLPFFYSDCLTTLQSHCRPAFWTGTSDNPGGPRMLAVSMFCSDHTSEEGGKRDPRDGTESDVVDRESEDDQRDGEGSVARSRSNKSERRRPERSKSSPTPHKSARKTDTARNWSRQGRETSTPTLTPTPTATPTPRIAHTRSVELRKLGDLASTWLDSVAAEEETVLSRVDHWLASTHGTLCCDSRCNCVDTEFLMATHMFGSPHAETQASSSIECGWDAFIESDQVETVWGDAEWDADDELSEDTGGNVRSCRKLFSTFSKTESVASPAKTHARSCLDVADAGTDGGGSDDTRIEIASCSSPSESDGVNFMRGNYYGDHHHEGEKKIDGYEGGARPQPPPPPPPGQGSGANRKGRAKAPHRRFGWLVMSCCRGGGQASVFSEEESMPGGGTLLQLPSPPQPQDDDNALRGKKKGEVEGRREEKNRKERYNIRWLKERRGGGGGR